MRYTGWQFRFHPLPPVGLVSTLINNQIIPWKCYGCEREFDTLGGGICKACV